MGVGGGSGAAYIPVCGRERLRVCMRVGVSIPKTPPFCFPSFPFRFVSLSVCLSISLSVCASVSVPFSHSVLPFLPASGPGFAGFFPPSLPLQQSFLLISGLMFVR